MRRGRSANTARMERVSSIRATSVWNSPPAARRRPMIKVLVDGMCDDNAAITVERPRTKRDHLGTVVTHVLPDTQPALTLKLGTVVR